jgi:hypothetical protein
VISRARDLSESWRGGDEPPRRQPPKSQRTTGQTFGTLVVRSDEPPAAPHRHDPLALPDELHPRRIPGSETASIGDRIVAYLFNENHEKGKHKARVFRALGYTAANSGDFEAVILRQLPEVEGQFKKDNGWGGQNWEAVVNLPTTRGVLELRTYWEVRPGQPTKFLTAPPPKPIDK